MKIKYFIFILLIIFISSVFFFSCNDNSESNAEETTEDTQKSTEVNGVKAPYREMVSVPGGTFTQEDADDSGNSFEHTISSFEMGKYEVTYALWYEVYQWAISNGYKFANAGLEGTNFGGDGIDDYPIYENIGKKPTSSLKYEPVTMVNWRDTIVWCNAYSMLEGRTPVYRNADGDVIKDSRDDNADECDNAQPDWGADGYRLPTEGEWQYAASYIDGTDWTPSDYASGATDSYSNSGATAEVAWYDENSGDKTHTVGTKRANALGLYDMSGNVYEWCWDWYDDLPASARTDYRGSTAGSGRVLRGGSWSNDARHVPVGSRNYLSPSLEHFTLGFRLVRCP